MELVPALARYGYVLGRWQAAWRFASPELQRAVALAQISTAWDMFRRDAGPGDVGPAREPSAREIAMLTSNDPRRDGVLLWLADHGTPAIAEAATVMVRATEATRRLGSADSALLDVALDALRAPASGKRQIARAVLAGGAADEPALKGLGIVASAIEHLRADPAFMEGAGDEVRYALPGGTLAHFVPAPPGAAWALNLAMLARRPPLGSPVPCIGLASRQLFRAFEPEEIATALVDGAAEAVATGYGLFERIEPELRRGSEALRSMSRNSRARDAWSMVVALGMISRGHLARALKLSRAGADIQARALADVGLVNLGPAGQVKWAAQRPTESGENRTMATGEPSGVFAAFDTDMAEIDRLLARTATPVE